MVMMDNLSKLIGSYKNGNYNVSIYEDGTKVRTTEEESFISEFPECIDIKITDYCDLGCPYCHEDSTKLGIHGKIIDSKFIDTLKPFTELAIGGGNPLSHPDLLNFLKKLKERNVIANITVNINHFISNFNFIKVLAEEEYVRGIGVSVNSIISEEVIEKLKLFPNLVIHLINGVVDLDVVNKLSNKGLKILILGYKEFRRGLEFNNPLIQERKEELKLNISKLLKKFKVISFDNLALKQLDIKSILPSNLWEEFYMGDDGQHTMYIDMVKEEYARNSTSNTRFKLENDITSMFKTIKEYSCQSLK